MTACEPKPNSPFPPVDLPVNHLSDGNRHFSKGNYQEAIASFEKELAENPDEASAHLYIADCYSKLNDYDRAIDKYYAVVARWSA